jgi:hypothetical protein
LRRIARGGQHVDAERDQGRDGKAQDHVVVDAEHEGAQALVDLSRRPGKAGAIGVLVLLIRLHRSPFLAVSRCSLEGLEVCPRPPRWATTAEICEGRSFFARGKVKLQIFVKQEK